MELRFPDLVYSHSPVNTGTPPLSDKIFSDSSTIIDPPLLTNLAAIPAPCYKIPFEALTIASVSSSQISPLTTAILTPL